MVVKRPPAALHVVAKARATRWQEQYVGETL